MLLRAGDHVKEACCPSEDVLPQILVVDDAHQPLAHAGGVERPAHDVVLHRGQVLDATATDQDHRVLLEVVPDAGDVGGDLHLVRQADAGDLPKGRVRVRRGRRETARAGAPPQRQAPWETRPRALAGHQLSRPADGGELVYPYDSQGERTGIAAVMQALADAGIRLKDLRTSQSSLEEIFVQLTRNETTEEAA